MADPALSLPPVPGDGVVLRVEGISKTFPGTRALDSVALDVRRGEVHALIGTNGSGKSTLIKILAGVYAADPGGTISIGGERFDAAHFSPARARALGLHFVHQIPAVFPALSVAENLAIGRGFELARLRRISWGAQERRARELIERFHINARPREPLAALAPADRTLVAIARALQDQEGEQGGVLVLDEPTAALPAPEVERLLSALRRYAAAGQGIVYVSHHLEEVLHASDRVSALRDGRCVGTFVTREMNETKLVNAMLGRELGDAAVPKQRAAGSEPLLSVRGLGGARVASVTFELAAGEILGVAGLLGSGASELLRLLFGDLRVARGTLVFGGRDYAPANPAQAIASGVAYVPPDRMLQAAFAPMSVRHNISGARLAPFYGGLRLHHGAERAHALAAMQRFGIRAASDEQPLATLSGGNQQKVILARALAQAPRLLLLDEPTQGVDVHARAEIHAFLRAAAEQGKGVLVVSSDFDELARVCDRALVMARGRVTAEVSGADLDAKRLTELSHFSPEET